MIITCLLVPIPSWATGYDLDIIEPSDLERQKDNWIILDGRPLAEWNKMRLPGALSFSWEDYTRTDDSAVPYRVWPANELAKALGQMGIDENTPIVVYGDAETSWGGEGWTIWALTWIGHKGPVRLLSGGIHAWEKAGLPLESGTAISQRDSTNYQMAVRTNLNIATTELTSQMDKITLIDNRSGWEWVKGHLPGAIHLSWKDLFSGQDNHPISPAAYRKLLKDEDVPLDKPIVFYCTGGIRSGYAWLIHQLAGFSGGSNYEGGTEAWDKLASP